MKRQTSFWMGLVVGGLLVMLTNAAVQPVLAQDGPPGEGSQQGQQYVIQAGETLIDIADRFGVSLRELVRANPNLVQPGETINLPAVQSGIPQTGQQGQGGGATIQASDTLGSILGRYQLTELQVRHFLVQNAGLRLAENQNVTLPASANATGTGGAATGDQGQAATQTPGATQDQGQTNQSQQQGRAQGNFNCAAGDAQPGVMYAVQPGATLGDILDLMAVSRNDTGDDQATTDMLVEFVYLNCDLRFAEQQALVLPGAIPQTGTDQGQDQQGQAATPTPGATQGQGGQQDQQGQAQQGAIPQTGQAAQQDGFGASLRHPFADPDRLGPLAIYVVRSGDSLTRIANRFNTSIRDLLDRNPHITNPNVILRGQWILLHPGEMPVINPPGWEEFGLNQDQDQ